ncbi:HD domain-containing protein [Shewanella sp. Isolate11]|uniref:HD domain-containing protein n=1 Tax=Shewanella sp. Isolate11 TaxID=2908530 RepID=UPI001EFCF5E0|nr:HD domain-containing protein [Shewanella sp. Isolate11]MCG9698072.1 HD domain-containing protein [Shewanella sp. Isolate11]
MSVSPSLHLLEQQCVEYISSLQQTDAAHDLQHVKRVVKTAKLLAERSGAELAVVLPAAWLHDCVALPKNHPQRQQASLLAADQALIFLQSIHYPEQYLADIHHAIVAHSFSANVVATTIEAKVLQDADRLDALGAIGIARCIQVSCSLGRSLYHLEDPFCSGRIPDDGQFAIDHFYLKLLQLAQTMQTQAGKEEAEKRQAFMQQYLQQLACEI